MKVGCRLIISKFRTELSPNPPYIFAPKTEMFGTFIFKHAQATKSHDVGIKSANSICCKKPRVEGHPGDNTVLGDIEFVPNDACIPRVEGHPGDNTVLGDIEFVPNDACIVDLRMDLPNEVPGCFGVSISIRAERLTCLQ
ncbi:unnamed protein product [Ilex paraguariensis]|uniref:Uncharacterized protein n=1 Tax=Ilex paraguariensis TaxID=185542 RepID=A0ABC8U4W4_9AQUA